MSRFADLDETIPLPSHYFMVLARCQNESDPANCTNDLDLLSFILPQEQTTNEQVNVKEITLYFTNYFISFNFLSE